MAIEVEVDHSDLVAMEEVVEVEASGEIVEMTAEMIAEVVVEAGLASTVTELDIWQEIALMAIEEMVAEEEVALEEGEVVAGLATIATKKGTWQENVPKVIVEIAEADKLEV